MRSTFSEEYYRMNWEKFIQEVPGEHYINLEAELEHTLEIYKELPAEAIEILKKIEAKKIVDKAIELCKKEMATVKALEAGEASLGYTTQTQEIQARGKLVRRFEFNCFQLAEFKKKYGISTGGQNYDEV